MRDTISSNLAEKDVIKRELQAGIFVIGTSFRVGPSTYHVFGYVGKIGDWDGENKKPTGFVRSKSLSSTIAHSRSTDAAIDLYNQEDKSKLNIISEIQK